MNSVIRGCCFLCRWKLFCLLLFSLWFISLLLAGCGDKVRLPSAQQLNEFENAGPLLPSVDTENLVKAKISSSEYRVRPDEVLELTMPAILQAVTKNEYREDEKYVPYICRVSEDGTINLPVVGELEISGMTMAEIESAVIDKYYPQYAVTRPSVFAKVLEYKTAKVSITGAVNKPGIYPLRSDQMTLVNLIMEAEGIIEDGAAVIKITHSNNQAHQDSENLIPGSYELKTIQTLQQLAGTVSRSFTSKTSNNRKVGVQLSFKRLSRSSTEGFLTIKAGDEILLTKQMDIADLLERLLVIKQLLKEPRISILDFEQKFTELADEIQQGSGVKENQGNIIQKNLLNPVANQELMRISQSLLQDNALQTASSNITNLKLKDAKLTSISPEKDSVKVQKKETDSWQSSDSKTVVLPVRGLYIPFADVVLEDGDSVIVERMQMPFVSVLGLVNKPGTYEYPTDVHYNLMQVLGLANGLDRPSDPRYATVYRLKPDGTITHAVFQVVKVKKESKLGYAMNTNIKPGDVIIVEDTPRTRTNMFLNRVFNLNFGAYYNLDNLLNR